MTPRLVELRVRDLGVIDDVTVELGAGMTALTGETGAGKTLLVDALSLLLGGRAEPATVRRGADESLIEAKFADDGGGDPDAAETVLTRSVARVGRSRSWIDGRMVTVATLGDRARELLELHGQHQHRALVTAGAQRRALDAFGGIERGPLEVCRGEVARLESEIARCGGDDQARAREADFLRFQLDEITAAAVTDEAEDERLDVEEDRLAAAS
ncbi:MAG TPA: AAA family ATPase, partial [Acidimicrobiales bacterium]|nr:AAA family ATPase [Acidimicrobiales bacterium]